MIEDDIDRMIAEIQNKPYDCSRYLDSNNPNVGKNGSNSNQFMDRNSSFVDSTQFQQKNASLTQSMAYDPRSNRFHQESNQKY